MDDSHAFEMHDLSALLNYFYDKKITWENLLQSSTSNLALDAGSFDTFLLKRGWLTEQQGEISFHPPLEKKYESVNAIAWDYENSGNKARYTKEYFEKILQSSYSFFDQDLNNALSIIALLVFFRCRAKKPSLEIKNFPNCTLLQTWQDFIVSLINDNPYVTQFSCCKHPDLQKIHARLIPSLARNRWLQYNHYQTVEPDNYWGVAARYWINYLHEHRDILSTVAATQPDQNNDKTPHSCFRKDITTMGKDGLSAVLRCLSDNKRSIEIMLGKHHPEFYLACPPEQLPECAQLMTKYLKQENAYFPFSKK